MFSSGVRVVLMIATMLAGMNAVAGVTAERTRVVFQGAQREASLALVNQNTYPVMVQAWVDDGELGSSPDTVAPVLPLPPLFRLAPGQQRSLRLLYSGEALPADRESMYWLNLYEIPPRPSELPAEGETRLTITLRTQMKVILRPEGLAGSAGDAVRRLKASSERRGLMMTNPTPYFISLSSVEARQGQVSVVLGADTLAPFSSKVLVGDRPVETGADVHFFWLDDDGNAQQATVVVH